MHSQRAESISTSSSTKDLLTRIDRYLKEEDDPQSPNSSTVADSEQDEPEAHDNPLENVKLSPAIETISVTGKTTIKPDGTIITDGSATITRSPFLSSNSNPSEPPDLELGESQYHALEHEAQDKPEPKRWYQRLGSGLYNLTVQPVVNSYNYAKKNKIVSGLSVLAALPSAINAFLAPSNTKPQDILSFWSKISTPVKIESVTNFFTSFIVNTIMNMQAIPASGRIVKRLFKRLINRERLLETCLTILACCVLGQQAAQAAASISFDAFIFATTTGDGIISLINAVSFTATRFMGVFFIINNNAHFWNKDAADQKEILYRVDHLHPDLIKALNNYLNSCEKLDEENAVKALTEVARLTSEYENARKPFFEKENTVLHYSKVAFDNITAFVFASYAFRLFTQSGYEGFRLLKPSAFEDITNANNDPVNVKAAAIGGTAGFASFLFYYSVLVNLTHTLSLTYKNIHSVKDAVSAIVLIGANYFAGSSLQSIAQRIIDNTHRIFGFDKGSSFVIMNRIAGTLVNTGSNLKKVFCNPNVEHPQHLDLLMWLEQNDLKSTDIETLKTLSFFSKARADLEYTQEVRHPPTQEEDMRAPLLMI